MVSYVCNYFYIPFSFGSKFSDHHFPLYKFYSPCKAWLIIFLLYESFPPTQLEIITPVSALPYHWPRFIMWPLIYMTVPHFYWGTDWVLSLLYMPFTLIWASTDCYCLLNWFSEFRVLKFIILFDRENLETGWKSNNKRMVKQCRIEQLTGILCFY